MYERWDCQRIILDEKFPNELYIPGIIFSAGSWIILWQVCGEKLHHMSYMFCFFYFWEKLHPVKYFLKFCQSCVCCQKWSYFLLSCQRTALFIATSLPLTIKTNRRRLLPIAEKIFPSNVFRANAFLLSSRQHGVAKDKRKHGVAHNQSPSTCSPAQSTHSRLVSIRSFRKTRFQTFEFPSSSSSPPSRVQDARRVMNVRLNFPQLMAVTTSKWWLLLMAVTWRLHLHLYSYSFPFLPLASYQF